MMRAALALALAPIAWAAPAAAWQASEAAVADEIVRTAVPPGALLDVLARAYDKGFVDKAAPHMASLERAHPGITGAARTAAAAELRGALTVELPQLYASLRAIYAQALTPAELVTLRDFYRSPAGRRMANAAVTGAGDQALSDIGRVPSSTITGRATEAGILRATDAVSPADAPSLRAFADSGVPAKLPALAPLQQQAVERWSASISPAVRSRLRAAIEASIRRHTNAHPTRKTAR